MHDIEEKIVIIIPCYNEEKRIRVDKFKDFINKNPSIHFCFVDDGSVDKTHHLLGQLLPNVSLLKNDTNLGKAESIRRGMIEMNKRDFFALGFWDADLATPLEEIPFFLDKMKNSSYQAILGSRILRLGSKITRNPFRHLLGRVFATLASLSLDMSIYDSQCGAKLFKRQIINCLFKDPFVSKWLFDIELVFRLKRTLIYRENPDIILEFPLDVWQDIKGSKLKLSDFLKVPWELLKINLTYRKDFPLEKTISLKKLG